MKSNLLMSKIKSIQNDYKELLSILLHKLQSKHAPEALDEINLFWTRHIYEVQLFLKFIFSGIESYVFTAVTFLDFDDNEHLPYLLLGEKHALDDPLSKYSEICNKMNEGKDAEFLYKQIGITAEDNLKILENDQSNILILPLRLLNQSSTSKSLFKIGEHAFISLFNGIMSLDDYFAKCHSIADIIQYARKDIGDMVMFSETDDHSFSLEERFRIALNNTDYMVNVEKSDSYNFFILVYGCIQQAIDIIVSCIEYNCIPYIRYPVSLHYISLLSESMLHIKHIKMMRYKMSVAFVVYKLCNKERLAQASLDDFLKEVQDFNFNKRLNDALEREGINEDNFMNHTITQLVIDKLEEFYHQLVDLKDCT